MLLSFVFFLIIMAQKQTKYKSIIRQVQCGNFSRYCACFPLNIKEKIL